jgi:hypothetical protein
MKLLYTLLCVVFVGETVHLACEMDDAVLHLHVNSAELLVAELFLNIGLYLCVRSILCGSNRNYYAQKQCKGCTSQDATIPSHDLPPAQDEVFVFR